ncbi:HlyD family type I secretion periplasmic adaptor subunit [Oceanicella actignis]|uniref:HlyD family type I secretion periplasmic adaptor subunit n=1 Tax=Oceanicella actignis TaxID=1189325 RepID=UPI0015B50602|nr:HlyD family type I secretion periplasmic adaptor subunit [Oceanicella actignis]
MAAPTRVRGLILWAALAAIAFFGVLGGWAMTATLDSAAVAPGVIQADGARRPVEHLEGGIVREVLVREGARVRKGDLLVRLDETRPLAQRNILRAQLAGALATLARLDAEDRDAAEVAPGAELVALMAADPALRALFAAEARAYAANRAARAGQLAILDQRIAQLREEIGGLELGLRSARTQLALVREELSDARALLAKGLMSRPRVLALRRAEAETEGRIGQISGAIARARQSIGETQERKLQIGRDRLETAARERQGALDRVNDLRQRLIAVEDALGRLEVRAPWSGTVVDPGVNAPGAVIEPGQRLLDILPDGAELVVEARLRPSDIDVAAPGQPVRVRLTAYSFRRTPPLPGTVTRISADSILDPAGGPPYYAVQIRLDPKALPAGGEVRALPGMQVEALIGTGSQTVAQYLTAPILGAMSTALLEK